MGKELACLGLIALTAFALPGSGLGSQQTGHQVSTHPTGTALATGTKLLATDIGNVV